MVTGRPLIGNADSEDKYYKHILNNDFDSFWKAHAIPDISESFRDFIERMVDSDPALRMKSSTEIRAHPWMLKRTANKDEVLKYVTRIYNC